MGTTDLWDVAIVGAGPAGLSLAVACAERGLRTVVFDPVAMRPWVPNYGAWLDELLGLHLEPFVAHRWRQVAVRCNDDEQVVQRAYGQIDGPALQASLRQRFRTAGGGLMTDAVVSVLHGQSTTALRTSGGQVVHAAMAVDATGIGRWLERPGAAPRTWQTAWGEWLTAPLHPFSPDTMTLMDFSGASSADRVPTFLYAMPFGRHRVFVEETALAANPQVELPELRRRLGRRLARRGLRLRRVEKVERCRIAMDRPLPDAPQRMLGFGAAAGYTHPATGYQLVRSLRRAPAVADALHDGLHQRRDAAERAETAWNVILPSQARRAQAVVQLAMRMVSRMAPADQGRFFVDFFRGDDRAWRTFLDGEGSPAELARCMVRTASGLRTSMQLELGRAAVGMGVSELALSP